MTKAEHYCPKEMLLKFEYAFKSAVDPTGMQALTQDIQRFCFSNKPPGDADATGLCK